MGPLSGSGSAMQTDVMLSGVQLLPAKPDLGEALG